jgi:hypothetical protein
VEEWVVGEEDGRGEGRGVEVVGRDRIVGTTSPLRNESAEIGRF